MSWTTGETATVRCPRCGMPVAVPVEIKQVDVVADHHPGTSTVRTWFKEQVNVTGHACADGQMPIERFVQSGALDDPLASREGAA